MKHPSKRPKKHLYPRSVLASLKGDQTACLAYIARRLRTRKERMKSREWWRQMQEIFAKEGDEEPV